MTASPESELAELGFALLQRRRDGSRQYGLRAHPYLSYWITLTAQGQAELTWELSLGQYLADRGLSVTGQDELSLLLFPAEDIRGRLEAGWAQSAIAQVQSVLGSLDFVAGT